MYKLLFVVLITIPSSANDFLSILTEDNSRYTDSGFIAENALFIIAGNMYAANAGNIKGSVKKNKNFYVIINNDTVSMKEFQRRILMTNNSLYKEKAIELVRIYHEYVLSSLYIENNCRRMRYYLKKAQKLAIKLNVLPEFEEIKNELTKFMKKMCSKNRKKDKKDPLQIISF